MTDDDQGAGTSPTLARRLEALLDGAEPVAVTASLGALIVAGIIGTFWTPVGDLMKSGLAVAVLGVPLLYLHRSNHRQTAALRDHIKMTTGAPLKKVTQYDGLRTLAELKQGERPNVLLLAHSGERYLSDLRSIDPSWGSFRVVVSDDSQIGLWESRPQSRGWALQASVLASAVPSDIHYAVLGDDCAVLGFYSVYGPGTVDYSHSLLVTPETAGSKELVTALRAHFDQRWLSAGGDASA